MGPTSAPFIIDNGPTLSLGNTEEENMFAGIFTALMVILVVASLIEGAAPKPLRKVLPVPLILFAISLIIGIIGVEVDPDKGFVASIASNTIDSDILQTAYLPPLLFADVMHLNLKIFRKSFWQVCWLVFPGVIAGAALTALFPLYLMPSGPPYFSTYESFAFGGAMSSTDPIAVLIILSDIGAPKRLSALIGGESLLNDGSSIIIVRLFLNLQAGMKYTGGKIVAFCFQELLVGPCIGIAFGFVVLLLMCLVEGNIVALVTLSFAAPYLVFTLCLFYLETSGVLAVIALGIVINRFGKSFLSHDFHVVEGFWDQVEFMAVMILYFQVGLLVAADLLQGNIEGVDWLSLLAFFLFILAVRLVIVVLSIPVLSRLGYGVSIKESVILWHAGLRGTISVLLSLSIKNSPGVDPRTGALVIFFTAGTVVLMILNVITAKPLCRLLKIGFDKDDLVFKRLRAQLEENTLHILHTTGMPDEDARRALSAEPAIQEKLLGISKGGLLSHLSSLIDEASLSAKRRILCSSFKATFDCLQVAKLIPRGSWLLLTNASEKLIASVEVGHLLQLEDIMNKNTMFSKWAKLSIRVAPHFVRHSGRNWERLKQILNGTFVSIEIGEREHNEDVLNIVATLTYSAYGLIVAHRRGRRHLQEMFISTQPDHISNVVHFPSEVHRLQEESRIACGTAAKLIDFVFAYFPGVIENIKRTHAQAQVHDGNIQLLSKMKHTGLAQGVLLQQLFKELELLDAHVGSLIFPVVEPYTIGNFGSALANNPNFGPFSKTESFNAGSFHSGYGKTPRNITSTEIDENATNDEDASPSSHSDGASGRDDQSLAGGIEPNETGLEQGFKDHEPMEEKREHVLVIEGSDVDEHVSGIDTPRELDRVLDEAELALANRIGDDPDLQVTLT